MDERLIRQNPWWREGPDAIERDPRIRAWRQSPVPWEPDIMPFDFTRPLIYTLRGPRQVGKSTLLKLIVRRLLSQGRRPETILYVDVERAGALSYRDLMDLLDGYLDWVHTRGLNGPRALILDEVTGITRWSTAIRALADSGRLAHSTVLATGSNAKDIKTGGDRLPGRRGAANTLDLALYPLCFSDYLGVVAPDLAEAIPAVDVGAVLHPGDMHAVVGEARLHGPEVRAWFNRYLSTGGYLLAVAEEVRGGRVPEHIYSLYRDAILGEVARLGRSEAVVRSLVSWLKGKLGEEFQWREMTRETGAANHETLRDTVEDLESAYVWHIYWRVKEPAGCDPALKSPKKLYPLDPFTWHMLSAWSWSGRPGWEHTTEAVADAVVTGHLVESVVADHLRRIFGPYGYYYRTRGGQEIDFSACRHGQPAGLIEVKYRNAVHRRDWRPLAEHGGGLLLTKRDFGWESDTGVAQLPIPLAMAVWPSASLFPVDW